MKSKEFASLARKLLPQCPRMIVHGTMLVMPPIEPVLRGLCFEGSSFDAKSFYVWAFWMPLYVPADTVSFNLGKRIREECGGDRWSAADDRVIEKLSSAIRSDALPFLCELETAKDVVVAAGRAAAGSRDPYAHQALAYSLAKAGDVAAAVDSIDVLLGLLSPLVPWQAELRTRAQSLKETLIAKKEDAAAMLDGWTAESIRRLGLEQLGGLAPGGGTTEKGTGATFPSS
jgi:hypothetical protein